MQSFKRVISLFIKHGAPLGLFVFLPLLVAMSLGLNLINFERDRHISELSSKLENSLIDIESEISPESFLLKVARGAWFTYNQTRNEPEKFWEYYNRLNSFLDTEPDLYVFNHKGSLITPKEFNLKSRFIATKLWETIISDYNQKSERSIKMKKQFKSFIGNEFKLSDFLDSRNRILPIIVNTKPGCLFWINSPKNNKEGILVIFWKIPSSCFRLTEITRRYNSRFDEGFIHNSSGSFEPFIFSKNKSISAEEIYRKTLLLDNNSNYIDSFGIIWKSLKLDDSTIYAGLRSRVTKYNLCYTSFWAFIVLLGVIAVSVYIWAEKRQSFYLSIRTKLIALFLIAVFTPVMGFSYLGYKYVGDMKANLCASAWNNGRDLLLNIDRELGHSGNAFCDDFRKLVKDFQHYDESPEVRNEIAKSLENFELALIEHRAASDAALIKQVMNPVISEGMSEVSDAFAKCCIDAMLNTNLMDKADPVLRGAMQGPECAMTSFWSKPDRVQTFVLGSSYFYLYWSLEENAKKEKQFYFVLKTVDKVLREQLRKRLAESKNNLKERDYIILACNNKNGEWFPDASFARPLKAISRRVAYMGKPIESEIIINSKPYLLLGLNSGHIRGYSFYALYPYEKISNELVKVTVYIVLAILFFVFMAFAIGNVLSETFLYPVSRLGDGVKAIEMRNSEFRIEPLQNDEFGDLAENFNKMIGDLKEMELAKYIQESLLPHSVPKIKGYELCFANRMASAVGGDYFDTIMLDSDHLCIIIGDVSGHGVASALVMAIAKAVLYHGFKETRNLLELFGDLNQVINTYFSKPPVKKMITLFAAIINLPTGKAVFTDAGHNFPMLVSKEGDVTELRMTGLPVGVMKKIKKQRIEEFAVNNGDTIVFYTDGIIEVTGKTEEQYGYDRFKNHLTEIACKDAKDILNELFFEYDKWLEGTMPDDDVTCVVLKRL